MSGYDVASVRGLYTSLSDGWTYLNAHAAPQVSEKVAAGVARSFRMANIVTALEVSAGSHSAQQVAGTLEGQSYVAAARMAVADLVGASPDSVVLGPSLPALYQSLARAVKPLMRRKASVVLSKLDDPQLYSAFTTGVATDVRWALPDLATGELPAYQYEELVDGTTRLVVLSAAHEFLGTVAPVADIIELVRSRSRAWTVLDVTALASYRSIDIAQLDADIVGIDLGALGGPQISALVFRDSSMFERLDSLSPVADVATAAKLETPVSTGLAGGVGPLVDHLAQLAGGTRGSRRKRLVASMNATHAYLDDLRLDLYIYLNTLSQVHIMGYSGEAAAEASDDRLPRLSFAVQGVPAHTVHQRLVDHGLVTTVTPHTPLLEDMGIAEIGGCVTVSLSPFSTHADVENLTRAVASLA